MLLFCNMWNEFRIVVVSPFNWTGEVRDHLPYSVEGKHSEHSPAISVLNVEILDLDVHGALALTLIGHGPLALIGLEEFFNHSLSWWLTESHALAGIVVGKWSHREVLPCQVPEGRKCWPWQEEGPMRVVHPVEGVHVHEIGLQVGVTKCVSQATDVAHPVLGLGWVGRGQVVELLL